MSVNYKYKYSITITNQFTWALTNSLAQKLSRFLGFYGFSAEQNGFT